jgi:hypothetical protein
VRRTSRRVTAHGIRIDHAPEGRAHGLRHPSVEGAG